jgi:hypothetical protein
MAPGGWLWRLLESPKYTGREPSISFPDLRNTKNRRCHRHRHRRTTQVEYGIDPISAKGKPNHDGVPGNSLNSTPMPQTRICCDKYRVALPARIRLFRGRRHLAQANQSGRRGKSRDEVEVTCVVELTNLAVGYDILILSVIALRDQRSGCLSQDMCCNHTVICIH